jgi:GT2 family glycosyltransferase
MIQIAVLITCYNRREKTLSCLRSLYIQQGKDSLYHLQVFLVDDGSSDNTSEFVRNEFPDIIIITGSGNLYWNKGMHLAWQRSLNEAQYDYVLWLNDDTTLYLQSITHMLRQFELSPQIGIVCGAIQSAVNGEFTYGGRDGRGIPIIPNDQIQLCTTINGNCVLISKIVQDSIGIIDPVFLHGMGDYDYGLRAIKKGYWVVTTKVYVGTCEKNPSVTSWFNYQVPLLSRLKRLYSPLGCHPYYYFIYERRHFGILKAIFHYFTIHLRAIVPRLWVVLNK